MKRLRLLPLHVRLRKPRKRYREHCYGARGRGIAFEFTFEQWWEIWKKSGHWHQRGKRSDQYCMSRFGDKGGYELGNVEIVTNHTNCSNKIYRPISEAHRKKLSTRFISLSELKNRSEAQRNRWARTTKEERQQHMQHARAKLSSQIISEATRKKHSENARGNRWGEIPYGRGFP
jgi:hypothetical protein